ncbi:tRNA pseudouridine(55) synthase TruB [Pseudokineococcus lusitanus]|uniref:tRNA pseudouridine synthase B n=1 Tax=Pseudokineococcus lusitanus TaxID=763993 RepID=A0A3N1HMB5_9ACTN|nr:tRNA pseudouridine(55) synthase TruB [Pseudokineococcus lusitanus]ROP43677.1 tRNA pseudouridine synthase B [Pseudokineococcus lusitanus]
MSRRGDLSTEGPGGLLVVDKPQGWTSHDVVARLRRVAGTRRVGHAGTLDPLATGVLVVGVGRATRLLTYLVGADKAYDAVVRLGESTTTDDAEGEPLPDVGTPAGARDVDPDGEPLRAGVAALTGALQQVPSSVSAIKVDGQRAYARVRGGEEVVLAARPVTVSAFDVHGAARATGVTGRPVLDLDVTVVVSSGTYVRALARDLGAALGTGGHLTALRRTRVGPYGLDGARTPDELAAEADAGPLTSLLPVADAAAAAFGVRRLTADEAADLAHGRRLAPDPDGPAGTEAAPVAAVAPDGTLVALVRDERGVTRPVLVLAPA